MIIKILICIIVFLILIWYIKTYNKLKTSLVKVEEADSGIDVALTKRYDVITQMTEVVKGYAKYEKETLFEIINLRKGMSIVEKNDANQKMDSILQRINIVVESYPKLKADKNFKLLQHSIIEVEEHLQAARRIYNSNTSIYNQLILVFPNNIVALLSGLKEKEFFKAEDVKTESVKIKL